MQYLVYFVFHFFAGKLSIVELAELNPLLGSKEDVVKTQSSAVQILRACLGHCRSGHLPFNVRNLTDQGIISRMAHMQTKQ